MLPTSTERIHVVTPIDWNLKLGLVWFASQFAWWIMDWCIVDYNNMMQISLLESLICFILIFTQNQSNEESEQVTQLVGGEYLSPPPKVSKIR